MGFGEQIHEIANRLPNNRQTLLFSATLPKVLVEFAKAGLTNPVLVRLDVDTKLPDELKLCFITCRAEEKLAVLMALLKHIVKADSQTVVFAATMHHVEYVHQVICALSSIFLCVQKSFLLRILNIKCKNSDFGCTSILEFKSLPRKEVWIFE